MILDQTHWSLYDMDRTHIESLLPFFLSRRRPVQTLAACDQVPWL